MAASSKQGYLQFLVIFFARRKKIVRFPSFFYFLISEFRIALVQLAVTSNKAQNLLRAKDKIKEAASNGAKIIALPVGFAFTLERFYFASKFRVLVTWQIYNNFVRNNAMLSAKFKLLTL